MTQPVKNGFNLSKKTKKKETTRKNRTRQIREKFKGDKEYGTSKLEEKFAKEFLDKLGVEYIYQYKAESIGRYYDFKLKNYQVYIEVDGDWYHSRGLVYEDMNPMQKRNHRVDKIKTDYCSRNGYLLIRIWEHDINKNPNLVMKCLKTILKPFLDKEKR